VYVAWLGSEIGRRTSTGNIAGGGGATNIFVGKAARGGGRRWRPHGPLPLLEISCVTHAPGALGASKADLVAIVARECAYCTAFLSPSSL